MMRIQETEKIVKRNETIIGQEEQRLKNDRKQTK